MPQCICSCHSVVRKDVKGLLVCRSTSVQDALWSFIPERLVLEAPFRGWRDQSCFISHTLMRVVAYQCSSICADIGARFQKYPIEIESVDRLE
jgi:hypothetical protein